MMPSEETPALAVAVAKRHSEHAAVVQVGDVLPRYLTPAVIRSAKAKIYYTGSKSTPRPGRSVLTDVMHRGGGNMHFRTLYHFLAGPTGRISLYQSELLSGSSKPLQTARHLAALVLLP